MISKELLSEVIGKKVIPSHEWESNIEYSFMVNDIKHSHSINIYELAHKCKEWANSTKYFRIDSNFVYRGNSFIYSGDLSHDKYFYADTEAEAIFKACQWILDNKDNQ